MVAKPHRGSKVALNERKRKALKGRALHSMPEDWQVAGFIKLLRRHAPELSERYRVKSLGVFGSHVRHEQRKGSDLDVLVEFSEAPSLLKFIELEDYLGDLLGVKVDLVMKDALKPAIGRHILAEVVLV